MSAPALVERLDALLPQTQCRQCGYDACLPYARAMATGEADINRCAPGGAAGIASLAAALGRTDRPGLDPAYGMERTRRVARVVEAHCIGCTLCIQACPVDAIAGAAKLMHTVIAEYCTGCGLCLPPCPVDCLELEPLPPTAAAWTRALADAARARYRYRNLRLARAKAPGGEEPSATIETERDPARFAAKQAVIHAALERARARIDQ